MSDAPFMSTETKPLTMSAEREAEIRRARDIDILSRVGEELLAELNATRTAHAETRDAYQSGTITLTP